MLRVEWLRMLRRGDGWRVEIGNILTQHKTGLQRCGIVGKKRWHSGRFDTYLQCSFEQVVKYHGFTTFASYLVSAKCEVGSAKSYKTSDYPGRNPF
jgi:hypothetical protein